MHGETLKHQMTYLQRQKGFKHCFFQRFKLTNCLQLVSKFERLELRFRFPCMFSEQGALLNTQTSCTFFLISETRMGCKFGILETKK